MLRLGTVMLKDCTSLVHKTKKADKELGDKSSKLLGVDEDFDIDALSDVSFKGKLSKSFRSTIRGSGSSSRHPC